MLTGIRPHPAFDLSVLPSHRHGQAPHGAYDVKPKTHYPRYK